MKKVWSSVLLALSLLLILPPAAASPKIKAGKVTAPGTLRPGQIIAVPLDRYWRGNVSLTAAGMADKKELFPHVPNLIEYRLELPVGGEYEVQAQYSAAAPSPMYLAVDGRPLGLVFAEAADHRGDWIGLGRFSVRPGSHRLRLTSRYVETPLPLVGALRLVFRGGAVPPPEPAPAVADRRAALPEDWYKGISRKVHLDFHTNGYVKGVGKHFDADEFAETLVEAGFNSVTIFAKCVHGYAYYDTKVGTRHPGLDFDLMRQQIEACRKRGITVWVYLSINQDEMYGTTLEGQAAQESKHTLTVDTSPDTPYVRDYVWPMIEECVRNYPIDGLFIDFPEGDRFVRETRKLVKSLNLGVAVSFNQQWDKPRAELSELDVLEIESWMHKQTLYYWSYVARYTRGTLPLTAMLIRFWSSWGDFGGLADEATLRYEVATGLAVGCGITVGDHLHPYGKLDKAVYERVGRVMREAARVEPFVTNSESMPYVALLRQTETASHALTDAGVHFTVVDATQDLALYKALVIPDGSKVDAAYVPKVEEYVRRGGRLIVTGSLTPEMARLLGVIPDGGVKPEPAYIRVDPARLPTPAATDLYSYQDVTPVRATADATVIAELVWAMNHGTSHRLYRQSPPMENVSGYAAIVSHKVGDGEAIYSAAPLLEIYAAQGYTAVREVLIDLLLRLIPPTERLAEVEAGVPLEVSVNRQGRRVVIHLVHCPQSRRANSTLSAKDYVHAEPIIDGTPTVAGAVLKLPEALVSGRRIRLINSGVALKPPQITDGMVAIIVPDFQISAVLAIE